MSETTLNGHADWQSRMVERAVARRLGIAQAQLRRLAKSLGVEPFAAPDGTKRYSTDQIEQLRAAQAALEELADDEDDEALPAGKKGERNLVSAYAYALVQAQQHNERLIGIICGPVERILSTYNQHQDRIDRRVAELEKGRDDANQARSIELQAAHDRAQEAKIVDAQIRRKDDLFSMVGAKLPGVLDAVASGLGLPKQDEITTATLDFLKSLNMMQLGLMLSEEAALTTPEQRELIRRVMKAANINLPDKLKDQPAAKESGPAQAPADATKG